MLSLLNQNRDRTRRHRSTGTYRVLVSEVPRLNQLRKARQIVAAVIGNALEWYDFVVYGFLTVIISRLFFPADSEYASLLLAMATFGVGFFMRPVGGILIGMYADRRGRKAALQLIILLMTISIAMIAFAPTYAAVGVAAPVLIVVARLLQGLATGGEPRGERGMSDVDQVAQDVAVPARDVRRELHARHHRDAPLDACARGGRDAPNRVVVGQGDGDQTE